MRHPALHVIIVLFVVTQAGCAGLNDATTSRPTTNTPATQTSAASTPTTTAGTSSPNATTPTDHLPGIEAERVFHRVERLLDVNASMPAVYTKTADVDLSASYSQFATLFGATNASSNPRTCGPIPWVRTNASAIVLSTKGLDAEEIELLLVHEYVHVIQEQTGRLTTDAPLHDPLVKTIGDRRVSRPLIEGAAVYVTDVYGRRHGLRWDGRRPLEHRRCLYEHPAPGLRQLWGWYYFGGRYYAQRLETPRNLARVYDDPPRTSEELIHAQPPGSEPIAELNVTVDTAGDWTVVATQPRGELALRAMLANELSEERAARAAAGWGADSAIELSTGDDLVRAAVWVVRFDTPADADEFRAAITDYQTAVEGRATVRSTLATPETVVLFAGPDSLVANATANGTPGNITVGLPANG